MIYRNFKAIKDMAGTWENREQNMCISDHVLYERKWVSLKQKDVINMEQLH